MSTKKPVKKVNIDKKSEPKHDERDDLIDSLQKQLEDEKQSREEKEAMYLRALADYQNFQKRAEQNEIRIREFASEDLIINLLEVLDDLDAFLSHFDEKGLEGVRKKLVSILENDGLIEIDALGKEFDPSEHEAIEQVNGHLGIVTKVHRKGYKYKEKLVRPTIVAVGNGEK